MMGTGQVHTRDSHWMAVNYLCPLLIKAEPTRLHTSSLCPIGGKHASWCTSCLRVIKPLLCSWSNQPCLPKWKHVACSLHEQQPCCSRICPWASGVYRLEAFLFSSSLKHRNLNLKHTCSLQKAPRYYLRIIINYKIGVCLPLLRLCILPCLCEL